MGKGRDRGRRRHDARDNEPSYDYAPQTFLPPGASLEATVKWFNPEKGFGFVELSDGSGDAFLHIATLQAAGQDALEPGTKLGVQIGQGQKGRQVTAVVSVDASAAHAPRPSVRAAPQRSSGRTRPDPSSASEAAGTVMWFNSAKGFGFVTCGDGQKDVFVHASILERAGLHGLNEGQRVTMKIVKTQKGREAISLTLLD